MSDPIRTIEEGRCIVYSGTPAAPITPEIVRETKSEPERITGEIEIYSSWIRVDEGVWFPRERVAEIKEQ
jgi:hypothetical protein